MGTPQRPPRTGGTGRRGRSPSPGAPRRRQRGSRQPGNAGARNICFPRAPSEQRSRHKAGIQGSEAGLGARPDHGPRAARGETEARGDRARQQHREPPRASPGLRHRSLPSPRLLPAASSSHPAFLGGPGLCQHPALGKAERLKHNIRGGGMIPIPNSFPSVPGASSLCQRFPRHPQPNSLPSPGHRRSGSEPLAWPRR